MIKKPTPAQIAAIHRRIFEVEREAWLRAHPGRTKREFNRLSNDMTSEVWAWRRARNRRAWAREKRAWRRDHGGKPMPEHWCSLSDKEYAELARWYRRRWRPVLP